MKIQILGSAAGGGFPQWNCGCANCVGARSGERGLTARTQDSIAISSDGERWFIVNASPDIHAQIARTPALHPRAPRHSPIAGVVLCNGDLDHVLGLFSLRESQPLSLYATKAVRRGLTENNFFRTLERFPEQVTWRELAIDCEVALDDALSLRPIAAHGKLPIHLEQRTTPSPEDNVALLVRDKKSKRSFLYASAAASLDNLLAIADEVDCLIFDGTFWSSDELIAQKLGTKRAQEMAHLPVVESVAALARCKARQKIFTHINNTNPILREGSNERAAIERAGFVVAHDGMEISL